jgi:hypothetical protein
MVPSTALWTNIQTTMASKNVHLRVNVINTPNVSSILRVLRVLKVPTTTDRIGFVSVNQASAEKVNWSKENRRTVQNLVMILTNAQREAMTALLCRLVLILSDHSCALVQKIHSAPAQLSTVASGLIAFPLILIKVTNAKTSMNVEKQTKLIGHHHVQLIKFASTTPGPLLVKPLSTIPRLLTHVMIQHSDAMGIPSFNAVQSVMSLLASMSMNAPHTN